MFWPQKGKKPESTPNAFRLYRNLPPEYGIAFRNEFVQRVPANPLNLRIERQLMCLISL
jgi:hypothetical protein